MARVSPPSAPFPRDGGLSDAGALHTTAVYFNEVLVADYQKNAALFVSVLLHSGTNAHFMHLQSKSYSQHKALGRYYEDVIDLADRYAEAFQGCYDVIDTYPADFHIAKVPLTYIQKIKDFVDGIRKVLPDDSQLQNIIDEVCELIDTTIYRLRELK